MGALLGLGTALAYGGHCQQVRTWGWGRAGLRWGWDVMSSLDLCFRPDVGLELDRLLGTSGASCSWLVGGGAASQTPGSTLEQVHAC